MYLMCNFSSFFSQLPNQSSVIISLTIFEAVKELYKVRFPIYIYISIGKNNTRIIDFGSKNDLHLIFFGQ